MDSSLAPHRCLPRLSPCGSCGTPIGLRGVRPPRSPQRVVAIGRRTAMAAGKNASLGGATTAAADAAAPPAGLGLAVHRRLLGGQVVFRGRRHRHGPFKLPQPEIRRDFRGRNQLPAASVAVIDRFLDNQRMDGVSVLVPTEDGKGAYVGPEELRALLFGQELDACIIDMFYFFLERRQAEAPEEYFDCHCITAYGKGYIMGWKDPKDKPKQIEYMNRIIQAIRPPIEKRQLIFSAMHFVNHWVLLVINLVEKSYEVYDSLKQHPKVDLQDYVCLLKDGLYDQLGFDTRKWPLITETKFPQQGAGDDCALFVCKAMECMSHKLTVGFPFGQEDMDLFRAKLALEFIEEMNRRNAAIAPVPPPDMPSS